MRRWEGIAYSVVAAFAVGAGLWYLQIDTAEKLRDSQALVATAVREAEIEACRINNLPRARDLIAVERSTTVDPRTVKDTHQLVGILWCAQTIDTRTAVLLTREQERIYVDLVRRDRWPIVSETGDVVGSEPLPVHPE